MMTPKTERDLARTAVLMTAWPDHDDALAALGAPAACLDLLGEPMLHRAVAQLARHGVRRIHAVVGDAADAVRAALGDGERWGVSLSYHYLVPAPSLGHFLQGIGLPTDGTCLLADALLVPAVPAAAAGAWHWIDDGRRLWTGWGCFDAGWLRDCPVPLTRTALERAVLGDPQQARPLVQPPVSATHATAFLDSALRLLTDDDGRPRPMPADARIHPTARLEQPVFIGRNVRIGAGAVIGPSAVIEHGAFIDRGATVRYAAVLPDTYIGQDLWVESALVRGNRLANVRLDVVTAIPDAALVRGLAPAVSSVPRAERLAAAALWLLLAPLAPAARWLAEPSRTAPQSARQMTMPQGDGLPARVVESRMQQPAESTASTPRALLSHFARTVHPGLRDVAAGRARLVGPQPRDPARIATLPAEWQRLYARFHCGLIGEQSAAPDSTATDDAAFASDAVACAQQGDPVTTRALLRRYLGAVARAAGACLRRQNHPASVRTKGADAPRQRTA